MKKFTILTLMILTSTSVHGQTRIYSNQDPSTGERDRKTVYTTAEKTAVKITETRILPQSFIDGQYQFLPPLPNPYGQATYQFIPYDPNPFSSSVRLENPTPLPSSYMPYSIPNYFGGSTTYWATSPPVFMPSPIIVLPRWRH